MQYHDISLAFLVPLEAVYVESALRHQLLFKLIKSTEGSSMTEGRHLQQADSAPVPAENPQEPQGEPPPSQTFEAEPYAEPPPLEVGLQGERQSKGDPPGRPPPEEDKDKLEPVYCETCDMWLNGSTQWERHKRGKMHRKKNLRRDVVFQYLHGDRQYRASKCLPSSINAPTSLVFFELIRQLYWRLQGERFRFHI